MGLRLLTALLAICVAVPSAAQSEYNADKILHRVSSEDLRAIVEIRGHEVRGVLARNGRFSMSLRKPEPHLQYFIVGEECIEKNDDCARIIFTTGYSPKAGLTLNTVNELNNEHVAKVSLETIAGGGQVVRVQRHLMTKEGVTMGSLTAELELYVRELAQIQEDTHP